ncbi:hypothetical protein KC19_VG304000 [Ceratodon purpureus]|uniref:Uncharacterized protein n=1 Tax=Ceratodon purpureus TaxID=3225 RepID=A0A8T0HW54_CERPU|nr:hypothetical protein KC19_VG304000 [Ceratodon purpureus]
MDLTMAEAEDEADSQDTAASLDQNLQPTQDTSIQETNYEDEGQREDNIITTTTMLQPSLNRQLTSDTPITPNISNFHALGDLDLPEDREHRTSQPGDQTTKQIEQETPLNDARLHMIP